MSLVLPREEAVENIFSRILSSDEACERLLETFYDHLCDDNKFIDPDPHHFAEVMLNAYKNGDVSAFLLEICNRSMFDLLKEAYLIPRRFHGKAGENPVLLTDVNGNLLEDKKSSVTNHEYKKFHEIYNTHTPAPRSRLYLADEVIAKTRHSIPGISLISVKSRRIKNVVFLFFMHFLILKN